MSRLPLCGDIVNSGKLATGIYIDKWNKKEELNYFSIV
jgi:hypothetical protein